MRKREEVFIRDELISCNTPAASHPQNQFQDQRRIDAHQFAGSVLILQLTTGNLTFIFRVISRVRCFKKNRFPSTFIMGMGCGFVIRAMNNPVAPSRPVGIQSSEGSRPIPGDTENKKKTIINGYFFMKLLSPVFHGQENKTGQNKTGQRSYFHIFELFGERAFVFNIAQVFAVFKLST